jgi:hypothetical protein
MESDSRMAGRVRAYKVGRSIDPSTASRPAFPDTEIVRRTDPKRRYRDTDFSPPGQNGA